MPTSRNESASEARAFNEGCDARMRGVAMSDNPHDVLSLATQWERGWMETHKNWGVEVKGRWFPRLLTNARSCEREAPTLARVEDGEKEVLNNLD